MTWMCSAAGLPRRKKLCFSRNKVDRRAVQRHDAAREEDLRKCDEIERAETAAQWRATHMERLATKIREAKHVDLLFGSAPSDVGETARVEHNGKFTAQQIMRVHKQATLLHAYYRLLDTEHFSVKEGIPRISQAGHPL